MVVGVGDARATDTADDLAFGLTAEQAAYAAWVRRVADDLVGIEPVHGAVNRPLVKAMGEAGLLRGLFGGGPDDRSVETAGPSPAQGPPRGAAAMQLCLLREM